MKFLISIVSVASIASQIMAADGFIGPRTTIGYMPIKAASLSTEMGGDKTVVEAYSDGAGLMLNNVNINYKPMSELVFKYGEEAVTNNVSLFDQVENISTTATLAEKSTSATIRLYSEEAIAALGCDDGNVNTINDEVVNGVCVGKMTVNSTCASTYTYNNSTQKCEKLSTETYASTKTLKGYTVSGNSLAAVTMSGVTRYFGIVKSGNYFRYRCDGAYGEYVYVKEDGTLSGDSVCGTLGIASKPGGFAGKSLGSGGTTGNTITIEGTSISGTSTYVSEVWGGMPTTYYAYIEKVNATTFRHKHYTYTGGSISFVPFTGGDECADNGTWNGSTCTKNVILQLAPICPTNYTFSSSIKKCVQN